MVVIEHIDLVEAGALVLIRVQGSHFLWKMVRRIVGVLAAVGRGDLKAADASAFLRSDGTASSVTPASLTAPAAGLFLERVRYEGDVAERDIRPVVNIGSANDAEI